MKKMMNNDYHWLHNCLFALILMLLFAACPDPGGKDYFDPSDTLEDPSEPSKEIVTGIFISAPELTLSYNGLDVENPDDDGKLRFTFSGAGFWGDDTGISYTVYIAPERYIKTTDIIKRALPGGILSGPFMFDPDATDTWKGEIGVYYSVIVVAEKAGEEGWAVSEVKQEKGFGTMDIDEGTGIIKSRGKSPWPGARTFYLDYERGDDNNGGIDPRKPWKTLEKANNTVFRAGDHILLEANSVWNGIPVDVSNWASQRSARGNGGMFAPQGNGTSERPIVVDLYEYDDETGKAYYSANQRPIINGNGTPFIANSTNPYGQSGAISLDAQDYWHIRNIEVTNSFQFPDIADNPSLLNTHWYNRAVRKALAGIDVNTSNPNKPACEGILIENCYSHDVQSEHNNNSNSTGSVTNTHFGAQSVPGKNGGGIIARMTQSEIKGNIVRRTALAGIRTMNAQNTTRGNKFTGNYIETVAGDGIVVTGNTTPDWFIVESNLLKDVNAAPGFGSANYAGAWGYMCANMLFQYNECYGILYGYQDGEAWDQDLGCPQTIYQYNYSHHNAGGTMLFMSASNGIYRYNVSANDGGSTRYMYKLLNDGDAPDDALPVGTGQSSYTAWSGGQTIFHYTYTGASASGTVPLIYNNTIFTGPDVDKVGLFGHNIGSNVDKYVRFYNNIVLVAGSGTTPKFFLSYGHGGSGYGNGSITNPVSGFTNNLLFAYDTSNPSSSAGNSNLISNGVAGMTPVTVENNNKWQNPLLKIQEMGSDGIAILRAQRDSTLPAAAYEDTSVLEAFTGKDRLRSRASLFMPTETSPDLKFGKPIPSVTGASIDGAWVGNLVHFSGEDFFGETVTNPPAVGVSQKPFNGVIYDPNS